MADVLDSKSSGSDTVRVRPPLPAPEKNPHLSTTSVGSFQLNPPFRVGEIVFDGEIPCGDEIRLDGGWVDLISSAKQISSEQCSDFIALCAISLKNEQSCSIIQLDKLEFIKLIRALLLLTLSQTRGNETERSHYLLFLVL